MARRIRSSISRPSSAAARRPISTSAMRSISTAGATCSRRARHVPGVAPRSFSPVRWRSMAASGSVDDSTALTPQTSYGTQKAIGELLVNDYTRKGFRRRPDPAPADHRGAPGQAQCGGVGLSPVRSSASPSRATTVSNPVTPGNPDADPVPASAPCRPSSTSTMRMARPSAPTGP